MSRTDGKGVIFEWLGATGTALNTLIAGRVWHRHVPATEKWQNDKACVIVNRTGGAPELVWKADSGEYTVKCFGGTARQADADAVADAVIALLHDRYSERTASGRIVRCEVTSRMDWADPDEGWPAVLMLVEVTTE